MDAAHRNIRELSALYGVARLLATESDIEKMLENILTLLSDEMGMKRGMITLLMRDFHEVHLDIAPGMKKKDIRSVRYGIGEGVTGKVISTGRPMAIPKLDENPLFLDRTGARRRIDRMNLAFICVPIKYRKDVVGALSVDTVARKTGTLEDEVNFLSAIADMIAQRVSARRKNEEENERLERENKGLKKQLEKIIHPREIIGNSRVMKEVYVLIGQVTDSNTTVLITGETGVGKELVAAAIHNSSPRSGGPFIRVNCAALPENLLESELFGHEKGSFTGAFERRVGRFEQAHGGTIFLDEIADLSLAAQAKLLRILQEKEFDRVGGGVTIKVNVRVIAATNRDLEKAVEKGEFRSDLFYRLNVFPIHLPPLRDRGADILLLADYFVQKYSSELKNKVLRINSPAIDALMAYHWPGNVRELENCIERAVLTSTDGVVHVFNLPPSLQMKERGIKETEYSTLDELVSAYERDLIEDALKYSGGNQSEAARRLGTTKRIIQYKIDKYGIDYKRYRSRGLPAD
ncbi:MAG TPA: sigma 54-interacting transcriptional regulator [bacterium]|nr:sigma 54-interacting transcriptional regulator [bacterium]